MKKGKLLGIISVLLIFGFVLMSCPNEVADDFSAKAPVIDGIKVEPNKNFFYPDDNIKLTVTASSPDFLFNFLSGNQIFHRNAERLGYCHSGIR